MKDSFHIQRVQEKQDLTVLNTFLYFMASRSLYCVYELLNNQCKHKSIVIHNLSPIHLNTLEKNQTSNISGPLMFSEQTGKEC